MLHTNNFLATSFGFKETSLINENSINILSNNNKYYNVSKPKNIGKKFFYELTTNYGFTINLLEYQSVYTLNRDFVKIKDLNNSDLIKFKANCFGKKNFYINDLEKIINFLKNLTNSEEILDGLGNIEEPELINSFSLNTLFELSKASILIIFKYLFITYSEYSSSIQNVTFKNLKLLKILQLLLLGFGIKADLVEFSLILCFKISDDILSFTDYFKSVKLKIVDQNFYEITDNENALIVNGFIIK